MYFSCSINTKMLEIISQKKKKKKEIPALKKLKIKINRDIRKLEINS